MQVIHLLNLTSREPYLRLTGQDSMQIIHLFNLTSREPYLKLALFPRPPEGLWNTQWRRT